MCQLFCTTKKESRPSTMIVGMPMKTALQRENCLLIKPQQEPPPLQEPQPLALQQLEPPRQQVPQQLPQQP